MNFVKTYDKFIIFLTWNVDKKAQYFKDFFQDLVMNFQDFSRTFVIFSKFQDFPGPHIFFQDFPGPVATLFFVLSFVHVFFVSHL